MLRRSARGLPPAFTRPSRTSARSPPSSRRGRSGDEKRSVRASCSSASRRRSRRRSRFPRPGSRSSARPAERRRRRPVTVTARARHDGRLGRAAVHRGRRGRRPGRHDLHLSRVRGRRQGRASPRPAAGRRPRRPRTGGRTGRPPSSLEDAAVPPITVGYRQADGSTGSGASQPIPLHIVSLLPKDPEDQKPADVRPPVGIPFGAPFLVACGVAARPDRGAPGAAPAPASQAQDGRRGRRSAARARRRRGPSRRSTELAGSRLLTRSGSRSSTWRSRRLAKRYLERRLGRRGAGDDLSRDDRVPARPPARPRPAAGRARPRACGRSREVRPRRGRGRDRRTPPRRGARRWSRPSRLGSAQPNPAATAKNDRQGSGMTDVLGFRFQEPLWLLAALRRSA